MMKRFEWLQARTAQDAARAATSTAAQLTVSGASKSGAKAGAHTGASTGKSAAESKAGSGAATPATANSPAVIKAGGIDLLDLLKEGLLMNCSRIVNIRELPGSRNASYEAGKGLVIGPNMTLTELEQHAEIRKHYKALSDAASHIAIPNIRNVATIAGNLLQRPRCWYFRSSDFHCLKKGGEHCFALDGENKFHAIFDNEVCPIVHPSTLAVALVALGATLDIFSADGKTKQVNLESFFVGPDKDVHKENSLGPNEVVTAIRLPDNNLRSAHLKLGEKDSFDWSIADCAVALEMKGEICKKASIILGSVAPVPWRARKAEALLAGKKIDETLAANAAEKALENAKPLSQNSYKVQLSRVMVARTILAAAGTKA